MKREWKWYHTNNKLYTKEETNRENEGKKVIRHTEYSKIAMVNPFYK